MDKTYIELEAETACLKIFFAGILVMFLAAFAVAYGDKHGLVALSVVGFVVGVVGEIGMFGLVLRTLQRSGEKIGLVETGGAAI